MPTIPSIRTSVENQFALVRDPHARSGSFLKDSRDRLIAYTGGFTVVFPYVVNSEKWAFRCWHTELGNVRRRFEIIASAIQGSNAKYLCDFAYTDDGIIVDGKIYPTTRMRWVEGTPIKDYICRQKSNKTALLTLADKFLQLVQDMHKNGFAHGDLQHGNIIVDSRGELFLVDYDSFYCKELKGEPDIITGLKDYQHPLRQSNQIVSEKLDYFSELIIYLSILGIAEKPFLVENYKVEGAEHMLFEAEDFNHLRSSRIYQELHGITLEIDTLLNILEEYLSKKSLNDLEPFDVLVERLTKDPEINSFGASCGKTCLSDEAFILSWSVVNYRKVLLDGKDVTSYSSTSKSISTDHTFTLEVWNGNKHVSKTLNLRVFSSPQTSFKASKNMLHKGRNESITLTWKVQNSDEITLLQNGITIKERCRANGTYTAKPQDNTTYTLKVLALDKKTIRTQSVSVEVHPDATIQFESDKEYVFPSIPFTLNWSTTNAKEVKLNGKKVSENGSQAVKKGIDVETTYTLQVTDAFGTKNKTIIVKMLPIPRIESLIVPVPDLAKTVDMEITLDTPTFKINMPSVNFEEIEIMPSEVYEMGVDTTSVQSPPKINLMSPEAPSIWKKVEKKFKQLLKI